jgi:hypothetical protein
MSDLVRIADIVDASAAVARTITGIAWAFGVGNGTVLDPYTGNQIQPPQGDPEPFTHVSELPRSPAGITWLSATVTEITWLVPMFLYVRMADYPTLLRTFAPFYGRYLGTFSQDMQLLGTANDARITGFTVGGGPDDGKPPFLGMTLTVRERLDFENLPGPKTY